MAKVTREETKQYAAAVLKQVKSWRPDLENKHIRAICSTLYNQLKDNKPSEPQA